MAEFVDELERFYDNKVDSLIKHMCETCGMSGRHCKCEVANVINLDNKDKVKLHQEICEKLNKIYKQKNADYGDSFAKARKEIKEYTLGKIYDKYERFKQLTKSENQVKSESIEDTLMDMANYCIMELLERGLDNE